MIPGMKEILRQTEEFLIILRATGCVVDKAIWVLPEEDAEWKLFLIIPAVAHERRVITLCVIDAVKTCGDMEFNMTDIFLKTTDEQYERSLPCRIVEGI